MAIRWLVMMVCVLLGATRVYATTALLQNTFGYIDQPLSTTDHVMVLGGV